MNLPEMTVCYGMTETSPVSFQIDAKDLNIIRRKSVGTIHPHVEVVVVDENDNILPVGEKGELCTRGYNVMIGYWGDEEKTKECIVDGNWMRTGDLAIIEETGYCHIVGRKKDMIIRGGENIYPREVEEFLYKHPDVKDVQIVGVKDDKVWAQLLLVRD